MYELFCKLPIKRSCLSVEPHRRLNSFALGFYTAMYPYSYSYIAPCLGMNGHPIAPVFTILRQVEAPVKINSSRRVPASIYSVKRSFITKQ